MGLSFSRPIAHRGLHDPGAGVVENSAAAFAAALERGFAIECDLQLTADDVPVVFHDADRARLTGHSGRVRDASLSELAARPLLGSAAGDRPQSFADFLDQVGGRALVQVELKHQADRAATEALARAAVRIAAPYRGPLAFKSFDPNLLTAIRRFGYTGPSGIVLTRVPPGETARDHGLTRLQHLVLRHLLHYPWSRFDFISCDHRYAGALPAVRLLRARGLRVTGWTVRSAVDAAAAAPHIDQIIFEGFDPDL